MLTIKLSRKFILPVLVSVMMIGCGFEAEFADKLAQYRDSKDPVLTQQQREQKERIKNILSRNPPKNSTPSSRHHNGSELQNQHQTPAVDKEAREKALKLNALNELIDGIDERHREKLEQVRSQLSPQAVAAVDATIAQEIDKLRGTLHGSRDYDLTVHRLQSLAWLDVLLNPTEIAGTSMLDVLESMVEQRKLIPFLNRYGRGQAAWQWFFYFAPYHSPPSPSSDPTALFVLQYTSALSGNGFALMTYTSSSFFWNARHKMEQVLRKRTEQLIARDEEAVQWLRSLGYDELADSLPPAQQVQGSLRTVRMLQYLESVTDEKHKRQLEFLVPDVGSETLWASMLCFTAGVAKDSRYHLTSMGELLEVMKVTELTGNVPEYGVDKSYYDYFVDYYEDLYDSTPSGSTDTFRVKQFAIPS